MEINQIVEKNSVTITKEERDAYMELLCSCNSARQMLIFATWDMSPSRWDKEYMR